MTEEKTKITDEIEGLKKCLTIKEQLFVDKILSGARVVDAYRDAGLFYGEIERDKLRGMAVALRSSPKIQAYIDAIQRSVAIRSVMTLDAIDQRLTDIAMTNVTDVIEIGEVFFPTGPGGSESAPVQMTSIKDFENMTEAQKAAISSIKPVSGGLEVKFHDKVKVMELLAKRKSGFVDKQEIKHYGKIETIAFLGDNGRGPK